MKRTEPTSSLPSRDDLGTIAAQWIARRDAGWTDADRRACETWRRADPRHAAAWREVESSWLVFDAPQRQGDAEAMVRELAARRHFRTRRRWRVAAGSVVALVAAACGAVALFVSPPSSPATSGQEARVAPVPSAVLLKPERRMLGDGSTVELNAGAEIAVNYSESQRGVRLVRGEAYFSVIKDPARPFVVTAGALEVRAVGTAFAVKIGTTAVDVLVTLGRVAVDRPPAAADPAPEPLAPPRSRVVFADAGRRVLGPADDTTGIPLRTEIVPMVEMERLLAWRGPRLELSGTPLAEAVAIFNRENEVRVVIADAALGGMRLSGMFRADDPDGFVRLLESHYAVAVERRATGEIVLRKAR